MDVPYCFNTFTASPAVPFHHRPAALSCPAAALPPSKGLPRLVAACAGGDEDGGAALLMFRNMAALLYRGVPRVMPKAEPAGSWSRVPPPDSDEEEEEEEEDEEGVSEEKGEELQCLEEETMAAGAREGREPGDYDRRAHLFDESSRVFRALKQREQGRRRRRRLGGS